MKQLSELKEKDIFDMLVAYGIDDLKPSNEMEFFDCTSEKFDMLVEIKCRKEHYDTLLIEREKYNKLIKHKNSRYVNSTPLGIYSFRLGLIKEPSWDIMAMPRTTDFDRNDKVLKEVGFLPIKKAQNLTNILYNETNFSKI